MMEKHTPGPWAVEPGVNDEVIAVLDGGAVVSIALINPRAELVAEMECRNSRLIAAAPDHALIGWAMCVQDGTWEEWGPSKGEFCFCGIRYVTTLDAFGCPVLTPALRAAITAAQGPSA